MSDLQLRNALSVFVTDERIVQWLQANDPKALEQALDALASPLFIAVGRHAWGLGPTVAAAKRVCREHGARGERLSVYQLPVGATRVSVGPLGDCSWQRPGHDDVGELTHVAGPNIVSRTSR